VAERLVAALQAEDFSGHDARTVQHHQTVRGPHELRVAAAPAHHFGNRERFQDSSHFRGEHVIQRDASRQAPMHENPTFGRIELFERIGRHIILAGEAFQRFGRLAVCIEPCFHRRALYFDALVLGYAANERELRR
jgi:hypothetical protein